MYNGREVIATLTSIPARMDYLHYTVETILAQDYPADRVVLSIPKHSKRLKGEKYKISKEIQKLVDEGKIELLRCEDYGPATKLLGVLKREMGKSKDTEPIIITFDDDVMYHSNAINNLLDSDDVENGSVVCRKGAVLYKSDVPWGYEESLGTCVFLKKKTRVDILFGCGGAAYRPSFFDDRIFEHEVDGAFYVDDIHISGNLARNGVDIYVLPASPSRWQKSVFDEGFSNSIDQATRNSRVHALSKINVDVTHTIDTLTHFEPWFEFSLGSTTG